MDGAIRHGCKQVSEVVELGADRDGRGGSGSVVSHNS